jgi:predicted nucleic-acid-binding protein
VAAFDTNVVVRLLVKDDEEQFQRAEQAFRRAAGSEGAWISTVVLVEVSWVLRVAYRFDRAAIALALKRLVASEGVVIEDAPLVSRALEAYETGTADFADYVILVASRNADALPLLTFDERLARAADAELVP